MLIPMIAVVLGLSASAHAVEDSKKCIQLPENPSPAISEYHIFPWPILDEKSGISASKKLSLREIGHWGSDRKMVEVPSLDPTKYNGLPGFVLAESGKLLATTGDATKGFGSNPHEAERSGNYERTAALSVASPVGTDAKQILFGKEAASVARWFPTQTKRKVTIPPCLKPPEPLKVGDSALDYGQILDDENGKSIRAFGDLIVNSSDHCQQICENKFGGAKLEGLLVLKAEKTTERWLLLSQDDYRETNVHRYMVLLIDSHGKIDPTKSFFTATSWFRESNDD